MTPGLPYTSRLLWKSLGTHVLVIMVVITIVWLAVDYFAADYFMQLMQEYGIEPVSSHQMFVSCVRRYLLWASVIALVVGAGLSLLLMRRVIGRLVQMTRITGKIAQGNYAAKIPVRSKDEVGQLATAFNTMTASLQRIEDLRKQMVIDVAHELRTPLTNIRGYLEGLVDGVVHPGQEVYESLLEETLRLNKLVEDTLRLARAESASASLNLEDLDLAEILKQSLDIFSRQFQDQGIDIEARISEELPTVRGDDSAVFQVISNLLQNALQYTSPGDTLEVTASRDAGGVLVEFANPNGDIGERELPLLFERFYRAEKSRSRNHGGAGVGLAVVKELVRAQKGEVGVRLDGDMIRFWFTLPG